MFVSNSHTCLAASSRLNHDWHHAFGRVLNTYGRHTLIRHCVSQLYKVRRLDPPKVISPLHHPESIMGSLLSCLEGLFSSRKPKRHNEQAREREPARHRRPTCKCPYKPVRESCICPHRAICRNRNARLHSGSCLCDVTSCDCRCSDRSRRRMTKHGHREAPLVPLYW